MKTLDTLEVEAAKPGNETANQQLQAPMAFYRGVCEANLGMAEKAQADFEAFLAVQPNATMDPSAYSKKAVAAFQAAEKNVAPPIEHRRHAVGVPGVQEFKLPPNSGEQINEKWGDGPVRWIMTSNEKTTWASLAGGPEWQEFVDKFWESRNPEPGNADNVFRTGFDRRVAFADANFVQAEGTRGSMTDRGMVFVLLGPPTYVGRKPIRTGDDSSEAAGLSTVGSQDQNIALQSAAASSRTGKISSGQAAQISAAHSGPGTKMIDTFQNWREVWHYRKELSAEGCGLPAGRRGVHHEGRLRQERPAARARDAHDTRRREEEAGIAGFRLATSGQRLVRAAAVEPHFGGLEGSEHGGPLEVRLRECFEDARHPEPGLGSDDDRAGAKPHLAAGVAGAFRGRADLPDVRKVRDLAQIEKHVGVRGNVRIGFELGEMAEHFLEHRLAGAAGQDAVELSVDVVGDGHREPKSIPASAS